MSKSSWNGRKVGEARAIMAQKLPAYCARGCGTWLTHESQWVVGHKKSRAAYPELTWEISNWQVECTECSNESSNEAKTEKEGRFFSSTGRQAVPAPPAFLSSSTSASTDSIQVNETRLWSNENQLAPAWMRPITPVPADASPPMYLTPPHPEATGSYGQEAIAYAKDKLQLDLRWWQKLQLIRQLEHRADGSLCWKTIISSAPRRSGKSVLLRVLALWRLEQTHFKEPQVIVHTGQDMAICREIQRHAWRYSEDVAGFNVSRSNGKEAIETPDGHRWLVRAQDAVFGYDVTLGLCDESFGVKPLSITDGLEPAMLERLSPQLLLTSTAHRKATSLMRTRITDALTVDDGETLLLLWTAPPGSDWSDPDTWRAASPHWTEDRRKTIAAKYAAATAGEVDPTFDDPDQLFGWASQYLNVWRLKERRITPGDPLIDATTWDTLEALLGPQTPSSAALESYFDQGYSLALGYRNGDGTTTVHVDLYDDLPGATRALRASGFAGTVQVGTSFAADPALRSFKVQPKTLRTNAAVSEFSRLLQEDLLRHTGTEHLTEQVLTVRTTPSADGKRITSKGRTDAIKAAVWATNAARKPKTKRPRILVASAPE